MLWRHVRWFLGQQKVTFTSYINQTNSRRDVWHPKKLSHLENFYRVVRSLVNFSLVMKSAKHVSKVREMFRRCEKICENDILMLVMTLHTQKLTLWFLDSNFWAKFQISWPGWFADRLIKIPHLENFYFLVRISAWLWNLEFPYQIRIQKLSSYFCMSCVITQVDTSFWCNFSQFFWPYQKFALKSKWFQGLCSDQHRKSSLSSHFFRHSKNLDVHNSNWVSFWNLAINSFRIFDKRVVYCAIKIELLCFFFS